MNIYDVVIVGGGTAGLMLARELGKFKCKTLIVDKKDNLLNFSFNTLGSLIDLKYFDLSEQVIAQKVDSLVFHSKHFKRTGKGQGYVLDKKKVHQELLNALDKAFISIRTGVQIKSIEQNNNKQFTSVTDAEGNQYYGKILVDASGTKGVISKKVGLIEQKTNLATGVEYNVKYLGKPNEAHLFIGKTYEGGYGWIFPLKNGRAIIGFGTLDNKIVKELKPRLNKILDLPVIKKLVIKDNDNVEGGSIPVTPVLKKFVINNLVCVGDSVSQVNPIVGEGYKFIFESALMASKAINKSLDKNDLNYLSEYESNWKKRFLKNYERAKRSQEKIFKYTKKDYLVDFAILGLKLRSDKRILRTLSGEHYDVNN
ncbi:MAG: NAD(P)/FAD-dependent oxidoreductase [Flavobacteriaceae bacterium]